MHTRRVPVQVRVTGDGGGVIDGAVVTIRPIDSAFTRGTTVSPERVVPRGDPETTSRDSLRYQRMLKIDFDSWTDGGTAQWGPWRHEIGCGPKFCNTSPPARPPNLLVIDRAPINPE